MNNTIYAVNLTTKTVEKVNTYVVHVHQSLRGVIGKNSKPVRHVILATSKAAASARITAKMEEWVAKKNDEAQFLDEANRAFHKPVYVVSKIQQVKVGE